MLRNFIYSLLFLLSSSVGVEAQLLREKEDIIATLGSNYTTGIDDKGNEYLDYEGEFGREAGEGYTRNTILYFQPYRDSLQVCTHLKLIYPESETLASRRYFDAQLEALDSMEWKDRETNYRYRMELVEPFCVITVWFDDEEQVRWKGNGNE